MLYLDTSVLLSLLVEDGFSAQADRMVRARQPVMLLVTDFAVAEAASALSFQARSGARPKALVQLAFAEIDIWVTENAELAEITPQDVSAATGLMRSLEFPLRTGDAIHLACARRREATLATFDRKLAECGTRLRLDVATS